jgi:hypothetical protein
LRKKRWPRRGRIEKKRTSGLENRGCDNGGKYDPVGAKRIIRIVTPIPGGKTEKRKWNDKKKIRYDKWGAGEAAESAVSKVYCTLIKYRHGSLILQRLRGL